MTFYLFITFRVSRLQTMRNSGHARLCDCLCVCLSLAAFPCTLLHGPGCNCGNSRGCPLVVHYWVDL